MSARSTHAVVVGASLAGTRAISAMREHGFEGRISLIGAEEHAPYDRPPLSKGVLAGDLAIDAIGLDFDPAALDVEARYGVRATALDPVSRRLALGDGETLGYDLLVVATGLSARMPDAWAGQENVQALRTLDDALSLRASLGRADRLVVIGAGFIGCEVAAHASKLGVGVTVVDPAPGPMARVLCTPGSEFAAAVHEDEDVRLLLGRGVTTVTGGTAPVVVLDDGTRLECDAVVVGIGGTPATDWLAGSGLTLADGVVCDEYGRTGLAGVYAAGDVARWRDPAGALTRMEHWTNATEMGRYIGRSLARGGADEPFTGATYAWSDQHGVRFESIGHRRHDDAVEVLHSSSADREFLAVYAREGRIVGAAAANMRRAFIQCRRLVDRQAPLTEGLDLLGAALV